MLEELKLNIAYISYEYPPDTSGGGIGTYTEQVATMLAANGHKVSVFCGTASASYSCRLNGVSVYRIQAQNTDEFRVRVVAVFTAVHTARPFDLMEGPDYGADGYLLKQQYPALPYVVKLHSPTYLIQQYNHFYRQYLLPKLFLTRLKNYIRGRDVYRCEDDIEYLNIQLADVILSPSKGLAKKIVHDWKIRSSLVHIVPNPYQPTAEQLAVPLRYNFKRITFIGKLSVLKGAADFPLLIQEVLTKRPDLSFRFIGDDSFSPEPQRSMKDYILHACKDWQKNLEFTGKVPLTKIGAYLRETDLVICPSLWENYPTVLLEAMSAGRVVIGSKTGGIPEIITHNRNGILVPVKQGKKAAKAILQCYQNPVKMEQLGANARTFVLGVSSAEQLTNRIITSYSKAVS